MTVDEYINMQAPLEKAELLRIRQIVKSMAPEAAEVMSYKIPGFKVKGKYLLGYAAFDGHLSLFPTPEPIRLLSGELKNFKTAKGTIQFTIDNPLPDELVRKIISLKLDQIG